VLGRGQPECPDGILEVLRAAGPSRLEEDVDVVGWGLDISRSEPLDGRLAAMRRAVVVVSRSLWKMGMGALPAPERH
jgi:hypothetical protein